MTFDQMIFMLFLITITSIAVADGGYYSDNAVYMRRASEVFHLLRTKPELFKDNNVDQREDYTTEIPKFDCPPLVPSAEVPKSVHRLRPSDVKVIAAFGDSLTAGNGVRAETVAQVFFVPNRGESWSIGGDRNLDDGVVTLTNILKKYNPDLIGGSMCAKTRLNDDSGFNVAVPGATNLGLDGQADDLINKLLTNEDVDYHNDWKVITFLIGGNDLCSGCLNDELFSPDAYVHGIQLALDKLHKHVARAFVNVVAMMDVSIVKDLIHPGREDECEQLHNLECSCAMAEWRNNGSAVGPRNMTLRETQLQYYKKLEELIDSGKYDDRPDFAVVLQPYLRDQTPFYFPNGTLDMSYIALDCFHLSHVSHQSFAFMLWNVMLTPVGKKPFKYDETAYPSYVCPSESQPYFYTKENSEENV